MSEFIRADGSEPADPAEKPGHVRVPVVLASCENAEAAVPAMIQLLSTLSRGWEPAQLRFVVSAGGDESPSAEWRVDAADLETASTVATNLQTIANAVLVDIRLGDPEPVGQSDGDEAADDAEGVPAAEETEPPVPVADFVASRQARVDYIRAVSSAWRAVREDTVRWTLTVDLDALLSPLVEGADDTGDANAYPETPAPWTVPASTRLVGARIRLFSHGRSRATGAITSLFAEDTLGAYGLQAVPASAGSAPLTWLPVNLAAHLLAAPARMVNGFPAPATDAEDLFGMFEQAATPHILVLGSSGQGKTVFLSRLVHRASELGEASVVVDVHDGWLAHCAIEFAGSTT
jgi:hypothetical protein